MSVSRGNAFRDNTFQSVDVCFVIQNVLWQIYSECADFLVLIGFEMLIQF